MNTIRLNRRELDHIRELFTTLNESGEYGSVELIQESDTGIGSTLNAKFYITHKNIEGDFIVTITDEENW